MTRRPSVRAIALGTAASLPAVLLAVQVSLAESSAGAAGPATSTPAAAPLLSIEPEPGPVPELSTETSDTVREADGSYTAEISTGPVNYQEDSGDWVPISNELVEAPGAAYAVENEGNSYTVSIPENPAATPVRFEVDGAWVTMKIVGADDVEPEVDGTEAVFEDVAGADEIIYEATDSGVKETIVLDAPPVSAPSYAYTLKVSPGITPVLTAEETVEFQDSSGDVAFVIPAGVMEDSAAPEPAYSNDVDYALTQNGSSWRFTVTPSAAWLSDPARVYPVLIDPSVDKPDHKDCWLQSDTPNTSRCNADYIRVGKVSGALRRGLLDFGVDSIPSAARIDNAELWLGLAVDQHTGNGGATGFSLYQPKEMWNSTATWNYSGTSSAPWNGGATGAPLSPNSPVMGNSGDGGWKGWNVTETVRRWRSTGSDHIANRGFLVRQQWETVSKSVGFISGTNNQYPTWRPILRVSYTNNPPTIGPITLTPVSPDGAKTSSTPTLAATVTDPESVPVAGCFYIYAAGGSNPIWSACDPDWTPSGSTKVVTAPSGPLQEGAYYTVVAYGYDGVNWSQASSRQFVVDSDATYSDDPPPPAMTSYGVDEYVVQDLRSIAASEGITFQQALARYGWVGDFQRRMSTVLDSHQQDFAWAEISRSGPVGVTVAFTGAVPADVASALSGLSAPVTLVTNEPFSHKQIVDFVGEAAESVVTQVGSGADVSADYDRATGRIEVAVYPGPVEASRASIEDGARAAVNAAAGPPNVNIPVDVVNASADSTSDEKVQGGGKITTASGSRCTAGWPVKGIEDDASGIVTANHCDNDMKFYTDPRSTRDVLSTSYSGLSTDQGDIQYHRSSEPIGRSFTYVPGVRRRIEGIAPAFLGTPVCLYGDTTKGAEDNGLNTLCTHVTSSTSSRFSPELGAIIRNLYATQKKVSEGGDSGGSWFWGSTAYGVHSGWARRKGIFEKRSQFTPVWYNLRFGMGLEINY